MTRPQIIKGVSNSIFLFVMIYFLNKHEGVNYKSRRKGFRTGLLLMLAYITRGFVMMGIPFFND